VVQSKIDRFFAPIKLIFSQGTEKQTRVQWKIQSSITLTTFLLPLYKIAKRRRIADMFLVRLTHLYLLSGFKKPLLPHHTHTHVYEHIHAHVHMPLSWT
jgi:hypothetical protein